MKYLLIAIMVGAGMALQPTNTSASHNSHCAVSAKLLSLSCNQEREEEYFEHLANCRNISSFSDKRRCDGDAARERRQARSDCLAQRSARLHACQLLDEGRYDPDPLVDPQLSFIDPDAIPGQFAPNPYVSLVAGSTRVLRAGEDGEEIVVIHVTDEVREIQGVMCRVVVDAAVIEEEDGGEIEYEAEEVTDDWFAQTTNGDVYYCGELSRNFEDDSLNNLDGSFQAGEDFAKAGILFLFNPMPGDAHRQEFALGEAEDIVEYIDLSTSPSNAEGGENDQFPCAGACIKTHDSTPIEPDSTEFKYYLPNIGMVLAVGLEEGEPSGDREELICHGNSLEILSDSACGIANPKALLDTLCELSPEGFCDDDDDREPRR